MLITTAQNCRVWWILQSSTTPRPATRTVFSTRDDYIHNNHLPSRGQMQYAYRNNPVCVSSEHLSSNHSIATWHTASANHHKLFSICLVWHTFSAVQKHNCSHHLASTVTTAHDAIPGLSPTSNAATCSWMVQTLSAAPTHPTTPLQPGENPYHMLSIQQELLLLLSKR